MTTPNTQLETAAQWLREGAIALRGREPAADLYRVAEDCLKAAGVPHDTEEWLAKRGK
jgi:hypothetical protein